MYLCDTFASRIFFFFFFAFHKLRRRIPYGTTYLCMCKTKSGMGGGGWLRVLAAGSIPLNCSRITLACVYVTYLPPYVFENNIPCGMNYWGQRQMLHFKEYYSKFRDFYFFFFLCLACNCHISLPVHPRWKTLEINFPAFEIFWKKGDDVFFSILSSSITISCTYVLFYFSHFC